MISLIKHWWQCGASGTFQHCYVEWQLVQDFLGKLLRNYVLNSNPISLQFSSVQFSCSVVFNSLWPHKPQHARPPCSSPTPGVYSNSSPLSWWCHPAISPSIVPFYSCPQFVPAPGSFPMSQLFTWSGQSIGLSASASVLPMNTQDWSALGWTDWISLQSKGLSRVFSNSTFLGLSNPSLRNTKTYVHKHLSHHSLYQNYFQKNKINRCLLTIQWANKLY